MNSKSDSLKILPTTDALITSKNNHIKRANTLLIKSFPTEQNEQHLNKFISNSQANFELDKFASKTKLDIVPETINNLTQEKLIVHQRRPRVKWVARHAPLHNSSNFHASSLDDFQTMSMAETNIKQIIQLNPSISIPDLTKQEFDDQYPSFTEKIFSEDNDPALRCKTVSVLTSDEDDGDDDDEDNNNTNENINNINNATEENDQEAIVGIKELVDQGSQAILIDPKSKKKPKSPRRRKTKSSPKRVKNTNGSPNSPLLSLSTSTNQMTVSIDLTTPTNSTKTSTPTSKMEDNGQIKNLITVDTSKARSNLPVVRLCLRELGWKECPHSTNFESDIYWHSSSYYEAGNPVPYTSGRVNKFPGMGDLLRKVHLTRSLNNMRLLFPNEYDFYPKTWFLPEQSQQFKDDVRYIHHLDKKHNRSLTTFIVKPSDGSQGEGIYLLRDPSQIITTNRPHVIQEYIDRPLLLDGLKFDLRIYVLILNLYPLEIYLYDEGLARFATIDYKAPSSDNLNQTYMHLTNYSLNKRSANYKHPTDDKQTDGSKRKLSLVWRQLTEMFGSEKVENTKNLIIEMINKTIFAILPELRVDFECELPPAKRQNLSCFQIIGFDVILNDHLKPILLEVNSNPSLRIDFDKHEGGKIIYHSSPIDEEIKKPLVFETLKIALPKKKLHTIARHAQFQANDEIMAQRVEKVAQRRLEERSEKLKSARKTRFDMKLNPFFSRPLESIAKEFIRQQQEQQEQRKAQNSTPTHPIIYSRSHEELTPYIFISNSQQEPIKFYKNFSRRPKNLHTSIDDDDENGSPTTITTTTLVSEILPSTNLKQSAIKSALSRSLTAIDATAITSINSLKLIFSSDHKINRYQPLFLLDNISYLYLQLVVATGCKTMTNAQFRNFASVCGIISETITASSIDILYYQILKKWQQLVLRTTLTGLPFAAFIEAFFLLSQRKYPNAQNLLDSLNHLVLSCIRHLNSALQSPSSPSIHQTSQSLLHRSARSHNTPSPSLLNNRLNVSRSPTATSMHRSMVVPASAPIPRSPRSPHNQQSHHNNHHHHHHHHHYHQSSTLSIHNSDDKTKQNSLRQSAKSVFPLFFDVL